MEEVRLVLAEAQVTKKPQSVIENATFYMGIVHHKRKRRCNADYKG